MTTAIAPSGARAPVPRPAITRDRYHRYTFEGVTYPGVTGILKVVDKSDALMAWAARNTAEAALAQLDNLAALRDTVGPQGVISALTARSGWKRDEAAAIGSEIHAMAEVVANGGALPDMTNGIRARVDHYLAWWQSSGWTIRLAEAYVVNTTQGYGGTLDLLARDENGVTTLADVKSGKSIYPETRLQLVGYSEAEWIAPQDSPTAYPMPPIGRHVVLHVTEDGVRIVEVNPTEEDRAAWAACIPLSRWHTGQRRGRL